MISGRCAACKYLRRRCPSDCIFFPYFPPNNPERFASVHRIYGASNVAKMLQKLPRHLRGEAADTLCYEAECRTHDCVYGCVKTISQLHQEINKAECQLAKTRDEIAFICSSGGQGLQQPQTHQLQVQPKFNFLPGQINAGHTQIGSSSEAPLFT